MCFHSMLMDASVQGDLQRFIHSHGGGGHAGAVWGSGSCPRTLQHADQRNHSGNFC